QEYCKFLYEKKMGTSPVNNVVVSGLGLSLVHEFLTGQALEPARVSELLTEKSETLHWMARFYGRACRNYALHALALGGVYISGGVAARVPDLVTDDEFSREFHRSETMGHLLKNIPVFLNLNEESGLWGGAMAALSLFKK
ncbi:MAG: glucokinase, partial [Deltaproteobacteria bacterium]|nr:glucokinase [Deltaproteobacteria bacterium]